MVSAIARYRPKELVTPSTFIGCRILVDPVFLQEPLWFDPPSSWANSIVQGKTFPSSSVEGLQLWDRLEQQSSTAFGTVLGFSDREQSRFGEPTLITPRLGQGAFRVTITELYKRQCALTDGKVLPALDAAHIRPYADGGTHTKSNGVLLRKDIHSVFDAGYATIDDNYRFVVSSKVFDVFKNGSEYRRLHGSRIRLPTLISDWPDLEGLRWHNNNRFQG